MSYAAVLYLQQLLEEEVTHFLPRVVRAEILKAIYFHAEANDAVNSLNRFQIVRDVSQSDIAALKVRHRTGNRMIKSWLIPLSIKIGSIVEDLDDINARLEDFVHELDSGVICHSPDTLSQEREFANDLLSANQEIKEVLTSCKEASEAAFSLRCRLYTLRRGIHRYSANRIKIDDVNRIKIAADKAADFIEDFLTGTDHQLLEENDFMKVKSTGDLLKQVDQLLSDSLDRLSLPASIKRGIGSLCKFISSLCRCIRQKDEEVSWNLLPESNDVDLERIECTLLHGYRLPSDRNDALVDLDGQHLRNVIDELTNPPFQLKWCKFQKWLGLVKLTVRKSTKKVLSHILHSIGQHNSKIYGPNIEDKGELLSKCLKGRKFLIILDGLQNFEIWDDIQRFLPDDNNGSRVLLNSVLNSRSPKKSLIEHEDIVVGLDEDINKIIDELTRPPQRLSIATIAGTGGIGKTTLAKKVFHHPCVVYHFHCLAWVNTESSIDRVLLHLLHNIAPSHEEIQGLSIEDKGELLYRSLKGRKYLIIADGLWNFEVWDVAQRYFPDDQVGSRILITTRMTEFITNTNIPKNPPHCMTLLDKHRSWELLQRLVFGHNSCPAELVVVGKQIAERCEGLPLAIVVIAGVLRSIQTSLFCWQSIMRHVTSVVSVDPESCLDILAVSYNYLPHHLKACFLYMYAFPANCEVEVEYLLNLWIANGFLGPNSMNKLEIVAENYLNDLIATNLVSIGKRSLDGKVKTCFVPALVRQLCMREAQKESFMHVLEEGENTQVLEKQRHLIFNLDNLDDFQLLPPLPHLRSFMWLNPGSNFTSGMVLLQLSVFKWLRVLDIYFLPFDTFPLELLNLVNLRYLALNVTYELDARISQFLKLQTLVVYGPWFLQEGDANPILFLEFWKFPWLKNVYVKLPSCLRYPYPLQPLLDGLQAPSNLQSLSTITFSSCTKEVFFLMPNLRKLKVSETKEDFQYSESTKFFNNLSLLTKLETLKCSFYKGNGETRSLEWNVLPVNLKKLSLKGSCLSWDQMKFLSSLPRLETLKLKNSAFRGQKWVVTDDQVFGSLKQLLIDNTDLVNWEVESTDHFPCLDHLVLRSCKFLEKIPWGVGELSVLQVIELHDCSESAKDSAREFEEDYGSPKVITR